MTTTTGMCASLPCSPATAAFTNVICRPSATVDAGAGAAAALADEGAALAAVALPVLRHNLFTKINHTGLNETQILTLDLY